MITDVYILVWCPGPEALYGATLVFQTIRTGFPASRIHVLDNATAEPERSLIEQAAKRAGASYGYRPPPPILPENWFTSVLATSTDRSIAFVDPDIIFWELIEDRPGDHLVRGRLIDRFEDPFSGCSTLPRLHPSLLLIPDLPALQERLASMLTQRFAFRPFADLMWVDASGIWIRADTGAFLFSALRERCALFSPEELDRYDHLFCGSHLAMVAPSLPPKVRALLEWSHAEAKAGRLEPLRGLWRKQEAVFSTLRPVPY